MIIIVNYSHRAYPGIQASGSFSSILSSSSSALFAGVAALASSMTAKIISQKNRYILESSSDLNLFKFLFFLRGGTFPIPSEFNDISFGGATAQNKVSSYCHCLYNNKHSKMSIISNVDHSILLLKIETTM